MPLCSQMFIIAVYVDDILLARKSDERMTEVKRALSERFDVKDLGERHYFLGVNITQNPGSAKTSLVRTRM